jgi:hypothetical protein
MVDIGAITTCFMSFSRGKRHVGDNLLRGNPSKKRIAFLALSERFVHPLRSATAKGEQNPRQ